MKVVVEYHNNWLVEVLMAKLMRGEKKEKKREPINSYHDNVAAYKEVGRLDTQFFRNTSNSIIYE